MTLLSEASFLVTPNGYKASKLYAAIPTNGNGDMTFTRASTATRVNEAGLIELVPYNLFTYSEDFSQWTIFRSTVTSNATISPDGTINADLVNQDYPTTSVHGGVSRTKAVSTGVKYTYSIFVKKKEYSWIELAEQATSAGNISTWFDVENGVVGTVGAGSTAQIEDFGNDWYRCSISFTSAFTGNRNFTLYLTTGNGSTTANKVGGAYIFGGQLVEGTSVLTYQKTVDRLDIPRIDYTGGGCPSILLEPQRTNIVLRSEEFDNNTSFQKNLSSVSANTTTAPDGTLTADTWTGDGTSAQHSLAQVVSATSGVAYTQSVFAKKGTNNFLQIVGTGAIYTTATVFANFDLENGVVGLSGAGTTSTITDFGNGWYRCTMTATATATVSGNGFLLWLITSATASRAETNDLETSVHLWGAQVEAGAYPTSYIPTTTGTVTRNTDSFILNDVYTNNLITSAGGTWFIELNNNISYIRDAFALAITLADFSATNYLTLTFGGATVSAFVQVRKKIAGVESTIYGATTATVKFAIKWNGTTADVFANGTKVVSATSFTATNMQTFTGNGGDAPKFIKSTMLFPTPLSDSECIALTTL